MRPLFADDVVTALRSDPDETAAVEQARRIREERYRAWRRRRVVFMSASTAADPPEDLPRQRTRAAL
jgi:hypothetical protein